MIVDKGQLYFMAVLYILDGKQFMYSLRQLHEMTKKRAKDMIEAVNVQYV